MGRYSYDDMPPEGYKEKKKGGGKMTAAISAIGVLLTLIAIIIYLLFTPHENDSPDNESTVETVDVSPVEPEIIESSMTPSLPDDTSSVASETVPQRSIQAYEKASDDYQKIEYTDRVVEEGDTLLSIAEEYGLSSDTLVSVNKLSGADLPVGTVLRIPPMDGTLCTVMEGDTLESIASVYNPELTAPDLAALNGKQYTAVYTGEDIFVPSPGAIKGSVSYMFKSPIPGGRIIARFGELVDGEAIKGTVIAAEPGSAVCAAADGTVLDIFSHPKFGRSVTLLHENGYSTDYYALETFNVKVSEKVKQGDVIGTIGTSNEFFDDVAVVFSVEQYSVPLDPMNLTEF